MSWLDESVKKKQDWQKKIETERGQYKKIGQKKKNEFERLTPMVTQLLSDMGERYWGSFLFIKKYKVEDCHKEESWRYGYEWRCKSKDSQAYTGSRSWDVKLKFTPEGNASHFVVGAEMLFGTESTPDISESELKKLLVKEFEIGPH